MQVAAEIRWFWRDSPPPGLAEWFRSETVHGMPPGGGSVRTDHYLRDPRQVELGIKRRGARSATEVKSLVHVAPDGLAAPPFAGPIETWTKAATGALHLRATIAVEKQRWMRKLDTAGADPVDVPLGPDEAPLHGRGLPERACNAELTRITVAGGVWWTVGLEASGPLPTLDASLRAGTALLAARNPPPFGPALRAGYPAWLSLITPEPIPAVHVHALHHVQLAMPRGLEDQARSFYRDVLGLVEIAKPPVLAGRGGVWFAGGSLQLHLGVEADFRPARKAHPALLVEGLPELVGLCESAGYELVHDGDLPGFDRVYVTDPFGNRVELMEPRADA